MRSAQRLTRRRAAKTLAGTAATALAGCIKVNTSPVSQSGGGDDGTVRYELGATTSGWLGRKPPVIKDERNPTLELDPGVNVVLTWRNLDGKRHRLVIVDSSGDVLASTKSAAAKGATRTVEFAARQEMVAYFCEYHPAKMRGTMLVSSN